VFEMAGKISVADIDAVALLEELKLRVAIETPTQDSVAVNRLADRVEASALSAGLIVDRRPGTMGYGDILLVKTPRPIGSNKEPVLLLAHLDTVHESTI
jgi:glutamate carboxypeptidase